MKEPVRRFCPCGAQISLNSKRCPPCSVEAANAAKAAQKRKKRARQREEMSKTGLPEQLSVVKN